MTIISKSIDETSLLVERVNGDSKKLQTNAVNMSGLMKKLSEVEEAN